MDAPQLVGHELAMDKTYREGDYELIVFDEDLDDEDDE